MREDAFRRGRTSPEVRPHLQGPTSSLHSSLHNKSPAMRDFYLTQVSNKPGSVSPAEARSAKEGNDSYLSRSDVTIGLKRATCFHDVKSGFALASGGVYHPNRSPCGKEGLNPLLFTFTPF